MTITLPAEQERLMEQFLSQGTYLSADHVAAEALKLLRQRDDAEARLDQLRQDVAVGWAQADRGELLDGPTALAALLERARRGPSNAP